MSNIELECNECGEVETLWGTNITKIEDRCVKCGAIGQGFELSVVET